MGRFHFGFFFPGKVKPSSSSGFREGYAPVIECPVKCLFSSSRSFRGDNFGGLGKVLLLVGKRDPRITGAGGENSMLLDAARSDVEGGRGRPPRSKEKRKIGRRSLSSSPDGKAGKREIDVFLSLSLISFSRSQPARVGNYDFPQNIVSKKAFPPPNSPREDVWVVRPGERLFELLQLVGGEGGAVPALLPSLVGEAGLFAGGAGAAGVVVTGVARWKTSMFIFPTY